MTEIAGIIVGAILVIIIFKRKEDSQSILDRVFDRIFNRWTKWELDQSDVPYTKQISSPIGIVYHECKVYCDIYVKTNI